MVVLKSSLSDLFIIPLPMRRRAFIFALLLAGIVACDRGARFPTIAAGQAVLAFGDSVTFGTGAGAGEDWPSRLGSLTRWRITNAGVPGDTAEAAKERIESLLDEHRPVLVIIEVGGNDFLRRRSPKAVKEDLRRIVHAVRQRGAQSVLVAVPELSLLSLVARKPTDAPIYRELADEEKVPLIPDVFADVLAHPELCADQIHPNARGYQRMASAMHERLQKLGLAAP